RVPQLKVAGARLEIHKRTSRLKFIVLLRVQIQRNRVAKVVVLLRLHLADAAHSDYHASVGGILVCIERVNIWDFLKQLSLGVSPACAQPGRGDLKMEV